MQEALAGCIKGKDCMVENDLLNPQCHMGFEVWEGRVGKIVIIFLALGQILQK